MYVFLLYSIFLSNCLNVKIVSMYLLFLLQPICSSDKWKSIIGLNLVSVILTYKPAWLNSEIPCYCVTVVCSLSFSILVKQLIIVHSKVLLLCPRGKEYYVQQSNAYISLCLDNFCW